MSEGISVKGDAGQVVAGDSFQGPRTGSSASGNVVNVNFNPDRAETFISRQQRNEIWKLAKQVASRKGIKPVEVYGNHIFPLYKIAKIEHLPASQYWHVVSLLKKLGQPAVQAPRSSGHQSRQATVPVAVRSPHGGWLRYVFILTSAAILGWWFNVPGHVSVLFSAAKNSLFESSPSSSVPSADDSAGTCMYDGKAHSPGSIVSMAGVRSVCEAPSGGSDPVWVPVHPKPSKHRAQQKPTPSKPVQIDEQIQGVD